MLMHRCLDHRDLLKYFNMESCFKSIPNAFGQIIFLDMYI